MKKLLLAAAATALLAGTGLAPAQAEYLKEHRGGTIRLLARSAAGTLDPHINYTDQGWQMYQPVYDGLVIFRKAEGKDGFSVVPDLAEALPTDRPLTVVTASLPIAALLADASSAITVLMLGGRVRGRTLATVDHWATQMLSGFVIDLAFIGANGISRERGLTTPDPAVADVKAQVVRVSRRRVFSGIHPKFGASSFCRFAEVTDFEAIITDTALPASEAHRYSLLGPQVIRV